MESVEANSKKWFDLTDFDGEVWKDVVGYEGLYMISSYGRVKRLGRYSIDVMGRRMYYEERILKKHISKTTGYPNVNLSKDGKAYTYNVHSLIADAFIPNPDNLPCINHIDEVRSNSVLSNLERCTYLYNNTYGAAKEKRNSTWQSRKKAIIQYDLNGNIIAIHNKSLAQIKREFGYSVSGCVHGNKKTAGGFIWKKEGEIPLIKEWKYYNLPIIMYDYDGNIIAKFEKGLEDIKRTTDFDIDNIRGCIKGKSKTSQGYVWRLESDEFNYKKPQTHIKKEKSTNKRNGPRPVSQYSKELVFIQNFHSIIYAANTLGKPQAAPDITKCCQGKIKSAYGYIWKYAE